LLESGGALDGGLVHLLVLVDIVRRSIGDNRALVRRPRVSSAEVEVIGLFVDVVLNERVGRPAYIRSAVTPEIFDSGTNHRRRG
jgi:hypothetical protein